jgi:hypothetical protein
MPLSVVQATEGLKGRRISELRNDVEGSGSDLIWDTIPAFLQTKEGKPRITKVSIADVPAGIRTRHLWNTYLQRSRFSQLARLSELCIQVSLLFSFTEGQ